MSVEHFTVPTPADFEPVVVAVIKKTTAISQTAAIVTLTGDLGAGKTTFTQQLAKHLGITEPVVSPTFGIMKAYELLDHPRFDHLVHIDAYRIEDVSEIGPLRLQELFTTPRKLICLEWPENIASTLPTDRVAVTIDIATGDDRTVVVT
jgi:tRNA threonylcarbamoyladenosine biosynthesis protein TsaE